MTAVWLTAAALLLIAGAVAVGSLPRIDLRIEERALIGVVVTVLVGSAVTYLLALVAGLSVATVLGGDAIVVVAFGALSWRRRGEASAAWRDGWARLMLPDQRSHRIGLGLTALVTTVLFAVLFAHTLGVDAQGNLNAGFETVWADWSQHLTTSSSFAVAPTSRRAGKPLAAQVIIAVCITSSVMNSPLLFAKDHNLIRA